MHVQDAEPRFTLSTTRADAQRNRTRILAAARELVTRDRAAVRPDGPAGAPRRATGPPARPRPLAPARERLPRDGAAVRTDAIAGAAGLAVGTLYRHFPTKDALVAAVVEDSAQALVDLVEAARRRAAGGGGAGAGPGG